MSKFADKKYWIDLADRAIVSFAQGLIASLGLDQIGLLDVDWTQGLSLAGSYALLSILTTIAFRKTGDLTITELEADRNAKQAREEKAVG